jgi:WD40 repeat protein
MWIPWPDPATLAGRDVDNQAQQGGRLDDMGTAKRETRGRDDAAFAGEAESPKPTTWEPCVASEADAPFRTQTCRFVNQTIRAITRRPFSVAEQPIRCTNGESRSIPEQERTLSGSENSELFGAELSVAFTPDGKQVISGSDMGIVKIWDETEPDRIRILKGHYTGWVNTIVLAVSPDGRRIITGGEDGRIKIWHMVNFEVLTLAGFDKSVHSVTFRPDGKAVVFGLSDGGIGLWDWSSSDEAQRVHMLKEHTKWVHALRFAPDGSRLASGSGDGTVRLWKWTGESRPIDVDTFELPVSDAYALSFSADGSHLAMGLSGGYVAILNLADKKMRTLQADSSSIRAVAFNPADDSLALGLSDGHILIWAWKNNRMKTLSGHEGQIWSLAFSPDGKRLASGGSDESLRLWSLAEK